MIIQTCHLKRDGLARGWAAGAGCSASVLMEFFSSLVTLLLISSSDWLSLAVNLEVNQGWVAEATRRLWSSNRCLNLFSNPISRRLGVGEVALVIELPQADLQHVEGEEEVAHVVAGLQKIGILL